MHLICDERTRWTLRDAWRHVKARRPLVSPMLPYFQQLQELEREQLGLPSPSISTAEAGIFVPGSTYAPLPGTYSGRPKGVSLQGGAECGCDDDEAH